MSQNVHGTFVSEKINKVRWKPDPYDYSHSFLTGSWDNDDNHIQLWSFQTNVDDIDIYPFVVTGTPFEADVTELNFLNPNYFLASSSKGSLFYYKLLTENTGAVSIVEKTSWKNIHKFRNGDYSSCTAFATYENDVVTTGEDGTINLLNVNSQDVFRSLIDADSCPLKCVTFLKHNEIITGNLRGRMNIYDLRSESNKAINSFILSGDQIAATCLTYHPTQRHMVIAGDNEGSLIIWDLRHNTFPVNVLNAHSDSVSEIQFHPDQPDQLFTCSNSGEVWHWLNNKKSTMSTSLLNFDNAADTNPWFTNEASKNKFEVFMLMPKLHKSVNSLDLNRNQLLCGCDNEAVYLINNINIYI